MTYRYLSITLAVMQINPTALAVTRILAGLSQAALSKKSGVSQGYISGIEAGDKDASPEKIKTLADSIGVPIAALITDPTKEQVADARARISKRTPLSAALVEAEAS